MECGIQKKVYFKQKKIMTEIKIKINSCQDCPFFTSETQYTADSFERPEKWICKKKNKTYLLLLLFLGKKKLKCFYY